MNYSELLKLANSTNVEDLKLLLNSNINLALLVTVVQNPNCTEEIFKILLEKYSDCYVMYRYILLNKNCTSNIKYNILNIAKTTDNSELLYALYKSNYLNKDIESEVYVEIADNPNCPLELLERLANYKYDSYVRETVAWNSNITLDMLLEFSKDENGFVRCKAALNKKCPNDILVNFYKYDNFEYKSEYEEQFKNRIEERGINLSEY